MVGDAAMAALAAATAKDVRFIRLGPGGAWWGISRQTNSLRLGYYEAAFDLCMARRWGDIQADFTARGIGKTSGAIKRHVNQIEAFFTLPKTTL
ncbi:MAG TPA: hypothetical protein VHA35_01155, partial [Dongiaceae bacterium]|nr:hypothetical protein [Dongiaceae bacterium]